MTRMVARRQHTVKSGTDEPARSAAGDAASELVVQVFRLNGLLAAAGDAMAEPVGQSSARWRVLAAIEHEPHTVAQIARAWWLARQSVQRVADVLVREGLATYEENPSHRRAKLMRISESGLGALGTIRAAQRTWADALGDEVGEEDLREANEVLSRAIAALEAGEDPARR